MFAQLANGLGRIPFRVEIRDARLGRVIHTTVTNVLTFPDRTTLVQVVLSIDRCSFPHAGIYLVDLFCDNTWVCDTNLRLSDL